MPDSHPQLIAGRYRLTGQLGQGGMGRVWAARDDVLARDVAVKELVPPAGLTEFELRTLRERAIREARAIAMLHQPNVVRIFDVVFEGDDPWIIMELVPSRSLFDTVRDDGPMAPDRVARIGLGILAALRAAHRVGLLHRDVKPGNVLLAHDGRVVLTDFGLATAAGDASMTSTGVVLGSPQYLAPERALDGEVGPAADLWSLGATLYAAVEGRPPYVRSSPMATLAALATELPDPPERAGVLRHVLTALLQRDPADRADAETARRLLLAASVPGSPPPPNAPIYPEPTFATPKPAPAAPVPAVGGPAGAAPAAPVPAAPAPAAPVLAAPAPVAPIPAATAPVAPVPAASAPVADVPAASASAVPVSKPTLASPVPPTGVAGIAPAAAGVAAVITPRAGVASVVQAPAGVAPPVGSGRVAGVAGAVGSGRAAGIGAAVGSGRVAGVAGAVGSGPAAAVRSGPAAGTAAPLLPAPTPGMVVPAPAEAVPTSAGAVPTSAGAVPTSAGAIPPPPALVPIPVETVRGLAAAPCPPPDQRRTAATGSGETPSRGGPALSHRALLIMAIGVVLVLLTGGLIAYR